MTSASTSRATKSMRTAVRLDGKLGVMRGRNVVTGVHQNGLTLTSFGERPADE